MSSGVNSYSVASNSRYIDSTTWYTVFRPHPKKELYQEVLILSPLHFSNLIFTASIAV